ncbi:MAG: hypothetical protein IPL57_13070 [Rubrivivax sp.]|nr:hypothetical protein [Rubrivivax sp.]
MDALVSRAGLLLDLSRPADAARDVEALLKADPNDARGAYLSALLAERDGPDDGGEGIPCQVTSLLDPIPIEMLRYRPQLLMLGGLARFGWIKRKRPNPTLRASLRDQPGAPLPS